MLAVALWLAPSALAGPKLVRFVRPTGDTLVQKGTGPIRVIIQLRDGARLTKVDVDGVVVTRLLRPGPNGYYGALLSFARHLHYGFNDAFVQARGSGGRRASDHVRFIVAKRDDSLLRLTSFRTETAAAPLQVGLRATTGSNVRAALSVAAGASARVYVNNRRVDRAFSREGSRLIVRVGAAEGLRFGRNLVQILVHKTHPYKRQSSFDIESRTVYISRDAPIASAGEDHTITGGGLVRFDGRATKLPPGWTGRLFRWKIVSAPKGSKARLRNASGSRPTLVPGRPGVYQVRVSVRGTPVGVKRGLGASARLTGVSNDTNMVTVMPDIPPAGVRLDTLTDDGSVLLGGRPVPGTAKCAPPGQGSPCTRINYVVLNRQTLQVTYSGSVEATVSGIQLLGTNVGANSGSLNDLIVLNWVGFAGGAELEAERNALDKVLQMIGSEPLTAAQRQRITTDDDNSQFSAGSAVGVAGAPAGSAFVTLGYVPDCATTCGPIGPRGGLSGALRLNGVTEKYDFVFTDAIDFETETNQTPTDISPPQLTIKVGEKTYSQPDPGDGASGFHVLLLNAKTLEPLDSGERVITTNAGDGAQQPAEVQQLASLLARGVTQPDRPLVILQAFGTPWGNEFSWDQAARQIELLGGTRQVFNALNYGATDDGRALNGENFRDGSYAFVGRLDSTAPLAESSHSLNGLPGRLDGVLMRARDGGFEPMIAGPPRADGQSPINTQLLHIANQAPQPFPSFRSANGRPIALAQARAVQRFLGGTDVAKLCKAGAVCEIRKLYYQDDGADWGTIGSLLANAKDKCDTPPRGARFTAAQCNDIRQKLSGEMYDVARVQRYLGPLGLQRPFGFANTAGLANVTDIAQRITDAVQPPAANTSLNVLQTMSYLLLAASFAPTPGTPAAVIVGGLYAAFAAGGYFTTSAGEPDLIGPPVTTAAGKLGVELAGRYQQAGDNLDDLGRLIVSDDGKLTAVANKVDADPEWRLGNVGQASAELERAAKQTIYEALVPLAYPVMYDLGRSDDQVPGLHRGLPLANARDWECDSGYFFVPNKHLFADQSDGAQFIGRFPDPDPAWAPWAPIIAVAEAHAVGHGGDARIRGVPASITDQLFNSVAKGGLGLNKLQFYSPRNGFRYLPASPGTPVLADIVGSGLDRLVEFPYNSDFGSDRRIDCSDVPDPPGNSG